MTATQLIRRLRLVTGLILFTYLTTHFLNHMLGLISLEAMAAGREVFLLFWRNWLGQAALYSALLVHQLLACWSIYQRRSLRMPAWESAQLLLGLCVPPLLALHIFGTRGANLIYGLDDNYEIILFAQWINPVELAKQTAVLVIAWVHGCIGLHFWLRIRPWYPRWSTILYSAALLWPVLALIGFADRGREVLVLAQDPEWVAALIERSRLPAQEAIAAIYRAEKIFWAIFAACIGATFAARGLRNWLTRHRAIKVTYPDQRQIEIQPGTTILEASRQGGIEHASVCGGRGRCSTCRVQILQGAQHLPPISPEEQRVLDRVAAGPGVRLACQTKPTGDVTILPLLPPGASPRDAQDRPDYMQGHEEEIAILFADLRAFTRLSERKLPYDVVFLLNRYFRAMGSAVEASGGHLDKFIGDGVMALFGVGKSTEEGCREALEAARRMSVNLEEINRILAHDLTEPLRIGIGIHVGAAIVGEMGYGRATSVTAIGDAVNTASRIEGMTKELKAQLVLSAAVAEKAGVVLPDPMRHEIEIRGREERLQVLALVDAQRLPPLASRADKKKRRRETDRAPTPA